MLCYVSHGSAFKVIKLLGACMFFYASLVNTYFAFHKMSDSTVGSVENHLDSAALWKGCWICWWRTKWKMSAQDSGVLSWHSAEGKGAVEQTIWSVFTRLSKHSSLIIADSSLKTQTQKTWIRNEKIWPATRGWWRGTQPLQNSLIAIHLGDIFEN